MSSIPQVVTTLVSSLTSTSPGEINSALSCFTAFLTSAQLTHTSLTPLYPLLLPHLHSEATVINATTAVEELIERSSGMSESRGVTRFMTRSRTEELLLCWGCTDTVRLTIDNARAEGEASDEARATMKLLVVLGEHLTTFIFASTPTAAQNVGLTVNSPSVLQLLLSILAISNFPGHSSESYALCDLTLGFWLAFQEECSDLGLVKGPGEGREGREGQEHAWVVVEGVFRELANGLRLRAEYPPERVLHSWKKGEHLPLWFTSNQSIV